MTVSRPRAVIAGFGFAGSKLHLPLLRDAGFTVVGALARSDAAAERAAALGIAATREPASLSELRPDVVIVAVPDDAHEAVVDEILPFSPRAIVVDKPVAPTVAAAVRMAESAASAGVALVPFHNRRWDGDYLTLKSVVDENRLGDLIRVTSRFTHWSPKSGAGWRSQSRCGIDGWLGDLGSHLVDQLVHLLGPVESVSAEIRSVRHPGGPNDDCFLQLQHISGVFGHAFMSAVAPPAGARFEAQGREGSFRIEGTDPQFDQIFQGVNPGEPGWGENSSRANGVIAGSLTAEVPTAAGDWTNFYRALAEHLDAGAPAPVDIQDAIHGLRVLDAARRAAATRSVVEVV
ncbi:MAG: Gfo/Idh/MocA family oxidoreductase [Microbacterium sp.]|uniref:Gfo/Idh/MocA family oxidoreductase n=1 Tax=Microbacterium sp. TaxID=51671 RepID=UPI003F7CDABF